MNELDELLNKIQDILRKYRQHSMNGLTLVDLVDDMRFLAQLPDDATFYSDAHKAADDILLCAIHANLPYPEARRLGRLWKKVNKWYD